MIPKQTNGSCLVRFPTHLLSSLTSVAHFPRADCGTRLYPTGLQGSARPLRKLKLASQQAQTLRKPASSRVIVSELSEGDGAAHRSPWLLTAAAKYEQQEVLRQALPVFGGTLILLSLVLGDSCDVGIFVMLEFCVRM